MGRTSAPGGRHGEDARATGRLLGAGTAAAALLGLGYVARNWYRYGRSGDHGSDDPLLDRFMPIYEVREHHETAVLAPAAVTYAAARDLDLQQSPLIRAIFAGRELLMRSTRSPQEPSGTFLSQVLALGWGILAEEPGRELVLGAVTQPWEVDVNFRSLPPGEFAGYREPGYTKIVWTLAVAPRGTDRSIFSTETRVATTDPKSRKRFRRYWSVFSPGIMRIRREALRLVRLAAERRAEREALSVSLESIAEDLHLVPSQGSRT